MTYPLKILCKILAKRLESILPGPIMEDQNDFMIGHQGFHNVRRVLNILHDQRGASDIAFLALDAEKAFDRVEWTYLFEIIVVLAWGRVFVTGLNFCTRIPMLKLLPTTIFLNQ